MNQPSFPVATDLSCPNCFRELEIRYADNLFFCDCPCSNFTWAASGSRYARLPWKQALFSLSSHLQTRIHAIEALYDDEKSTPPTQLEVPPTRS